MFKLELSLLIVSLCLNSILTGYEYEQLVIDKVCTHKILAQIDNHYTSIQLKCSWNKFIDFNLNNRLKNYDDQHNKNFILYDIQFTESMQKLDAKYRVLRSNLFQNLKVKSLTLKGLGLEQIESDAFHISSFFYATHLDLSSNNIAKIPAKTFDNLPSLEHLNLSSNSMSFADNNFIKCTRLKTLDLSNNRIQYITQNQFNGLSSIELLDLSNNNIENVHACTFTNIKIRSLAKLYNPPLVNLNRNPIDCNCEIFYINRVLRFRLSLICTSPNYYKGREFSDLMDEDPSATCKYSTIEKLCQTNTMSLREIILILILNVLIVLIILCFCCFCAKNVKKSNRIRILREELNGLRKPKEAKKYYQNVKENDQTKLMLNQA